MFVAIVTEPFCPACLIISASLSFCLALSTLCGTPYLYRSCETNSLVSIETVPNKIGWPFS